MPTTSPLITGAVGPDFESEVGAFYLAALLLEGPVRGASFGAAAQVSFQQAALGAPIDDLTLRTRSDVGPLNLHLQLKHRVTLSGSDREFEAVIDKCWETLRKPEFLPPGNLVGVAIANFPAKVREHYARVPAWARSRSSAAEFFDQISLEGFAHREMSAFVKRVTEHIRSTNGTEATDELLWTFFKRLVLVDFDVMQDASRDRAYTLESLRRLVPDGVLTGANTLYEQLRRIAREGNQTAGGHTPQSLRERLVREGTAINPPADCMRDLAKLDQESTLVIGSITRTIGGVVLDRSEVVNDILQRVDAGKVIIVTGESGAGKSAIVRAVAESRAVDGPVLALSWRRLGTASGWSGLASSLGIEHLLQELLTAMEGATRPCVIIDGIDRVDSVGGQQAVNDLLLAVRARSEGRNWAVVLTCQRETLADVRAWLRLPSTGAEFVDTPPLVDVDIQALVHGLPHLASLLESSALSPVVRNPFFLRILVETSDSSSSTLGDDAIGAHALTEAYAYRVWWNRLIGRGGSLGIARQQALLRLGDRVLIDRARRFPIQDIDGLVLQSLLFDRVVNRDRDGDVFSFNHDIIESWIVSRVLSQREDPVFFLATLDDPYWAFRPLQLVACGALEDPRGPGRWRDLLARAEQIGGRSGARWAEAVATAPLRSARIGEYLPVIADILLANDGSWLIALVNSLLTTATRLDPLLQTVVQRSGLTPAEQQALLLPRSQPIVERWTPLLTWLAPQFRTIPYAMRDVVSRAMLIWQNTPIGLPFRREIAEAALAWRELPARGPGVFLYITPEQQTVRNRLRDIVALSADVIPERIPAFLRSVIKDDGEYDARRWLADQPQAQLARNAAEAYVDFALDLLVPAWRLETDDSVDSIDTDTSSEELGDDANDTIVPPDIRPSSRTNLDPDLEHLEHALEFTMPSHLRGPFLLLLLANESEGLRLINTLVNRATAAYQRRDRLNRAVWGRREPMREPLDASSDEMEPSLTLHFDHRDQWFEGGVNAYVWYRQQGQGSHAVCSGLMALEVWMERQIEAGRDAEELFRSVLQESTSTATIGVCVAVSLAYRDRCLHAAAPFVSCPMLWDWDMNRRALDATNASFSVSGFLGLQADFHERTTASRNSRPQRGTDLREFAMNYVFAEDASLRDRVRTTIRGFPDDLSYLSTAEREKPEVVDAYRRHMEEHAALADPANYHAFQDDSGGIVALQFVPPKDIRERHALATQRLERSNRCARLLNWATQSRDAQAPALGRTLADAVEEARALSTPSDFATRYSVDGEMEYLRLGAIAAVAALVPVLDPPRALTGDLKEWCSDVLIASAAMPREERFGTSSLIHGDPLLSAATGLFHLVRLRVGSVRVYEAAFELVDHENEEVGRAIAAGIQKSWASNPVFCWNALSLLIARASEPIIESDEVDMHIDFEKKRAVARAADESAKDEFLAHLRAQQKPAPPVLVLGQSRRLRTRYLVSVLKLLAERFE